MRTRNSRNALQKTVLSSALALVLTAPFAGSVYAQSGATAQEKVAAEEKAKAEAEAKAAKDKADPKKIDNVQVVGSRIKRTEIEGPSPVTIISREDIDKEGFETVADVLGSLTQNTTNSFTGELAVTGFTPNAQVVNLRNLGPGYTLILVNGRRLADYPQPYNRDNSSVNVSAIPTSIVERIEVLSGGASAIYGSDAVAGVVNIVTKTVVDENTLRLTLGTTDMGGGDRVDLEFTGGMSGDDWNFVYALQGMKEDPIFASQRSFMDDLRDGPLGENVAPGLSLIAINALNSRALYYPGQDVCDSFGHSTFASPTRGLICGSYDAVASRSISNERENYSVYLYGDKQISDNHQLWSSLTYYDSKAIASAGTEFWGSSGDPLNKNKSGALTAFMYINAVPASDLNPAIPKGLVQLQRVLMPFEVGGNEAVSTNFDEQTYDFAVGMRGALTDTFDYSASLSTARYEYVQDRPRLLAKSVHDRFVTAVLDANGNQVFVNTAGNATGLSNAIYPLYNFNAAAWATPLTPEEYRSISTRVINEGVTTANQFSFTVNGDLMDMPAGPLGFAGTFEWADQSIDLESDPRTDPTRPVDASTPYNLRSSGRVVGDRSRIALGGELSVPVLDSLKLQLAARYDKYDDITEVDDAITYNLGVEWRPTDKLLVRGAYATSFRAPDMPLVFAEGAAGFTGAVDQLACRTAGFTPTQCGTSGNAGNVYSYTMQNATSGYPDLKEEEGESISFGFVYDFGNNLNMSVDYYRIDLSDAASVQSLGSILGAEANCTFGTFSNGDPYPNAPDSAYCQSIYPLVSRDAPLAGDAVFGEIGRVNLVNTGAINTAFSSNSGIDATLGYFYETESAGQFGLDLGYTLILTEKYKQFDTDPLIDYRDSLFGNGQRSRVRGSVSWEYEKFNTTLFGYRYGSAPNAAATNRLQPWMVYNLTMGYEFTEKFNATFIINNLLNNYTRFDPTNTAYPFYDAFIGQDPRGRAFSLRAEYKF